MACLFMTAMSVSLVLNGRDEEKAGQLYEEMSRSSGVAYMKNFD
jgi:hypothetical protein